MEIISRQEAIAKGLSRYFTGEPCKHGHINYRRVNGRACASCNDDRVRKHAAAKGRNVGLFARTVASKANAVKNGNSTYMSETKCPAGHFERYVSDGGCVKCRTELSKKHNILRYGITVEYYEYLYILQNNSCKICKSAFSDSKYKANIDHCHSTGKVRGLLCSFCNTALGSFRDDINLLQSAIEYLRASKDETCPA